MEWRMASQRTTVHKERTMER